jgi:RTX calcium-binding nonapeptide repeat (4 copies)
MKRAILTALTMLVAWAAPSAHATEPPLTVLLAGGAEENRISIGLSPDGRSYVIDSIVPLEVGGEVCWHPEGQETELMCEAARIGGFEVNVGAGDDFVLIDPKLRIPVTLRGGPGNDRLSGGGGNDKLVGGSGNDILSGRGGEDALFGGSGDDLLLGGSGDDQLVGGLGVDRLHGQAGDNELIE